MPPPPDDLRGADGLCGLCGGREHGYGCPRSQMPAQQAAEHWARYQAARELHPAIRAGRLTVEQRRELLAWDRAVAALGAIAAGRRRLREIGEEAER